jgi:hypothetical protein
MQKMLLNSGLGSTWIFQNMKLKFIPLGTHSRSPRIKPAKQWCIFLFVGFIKKLTSEALLQTEWGSALIPLWP